MGNPYAPPPERSRGAGAPSGPPSAQEPVARPPSGTGPTPPERPGATPDQVRTAGRGVLRFGLTTMGALVATSLPLPWQAAGAVLSVLAVVLGVRAARAVWRTPPLRRPLLPLLVVGFAVAGASLVTSLTVVATWPIQQAYQDCLGRALTVSARQTCDTEFRDALAERLTPPGGSSATP